MYVARRSRDAHGRPQRGPGRRYEQGCPKQKTLQMNTHEPGARLQMGYRWLSYVAIFFSGAISGALTGSESGPMRFSLSVEDMGNLGALLGGLFALVGCRFAIERSEAK